VTLFSQVLVLGGHNLEISASIGIAVCPDDGTAAVPLWRGAESALRHAQEMGGGRITWLGPELSSVSEQEVELESYMRSQLKTADSTSSISQSTAWTGQCIVAKRCSD
jgi:predicted signal transduction protein with EAL and GGDEF domain